MPNDNPKTRDGRPTPQNLSNFGDNAVRDCHGDCRCLQPERE